jgi:hypothetical protein
MMKKTLVILFLLVGISASFAQEISYTTVKSEFDSFQYENMIKSSSLLLAKGILSDSLAIDVHMMRAVAFYSMGNDISTRNNFESILKIRRNFNPDPAQISPKLISLFGEVKADYLKRNPLSITESDTTKQVITPVKLFGQAKMKGLFLENLVLPGIAQLQLGKNPKGILLTAVSAINLGAMIYYSIDTKNKEDEYLKQTEKQLILEKYSEYNDSYKIRNALIVSYALIWVYSQVDLLFFSEDDSANATFQQVGEILQLHPDFCNNYKLSLRIPF